MNLHFQSSIPAGFNDDSRVWIYQCNRAFQENEMTEIRKLLDDFILGWNSHGTPVTGFAGLFFNRFIIFMADETKTGVSGCSTDSSVRLIKAIEEKYQVNLFDRQSLAFIINNEIRIIHLPELQKAAENRMIDEETIYFNNTVLTKKELLDHWITPVKNSWLRKQFPVHS